MLDNNQMQNFTFKKILGGVLGIILLVFLFAFGGGAYEQVDAGEICVIQDPFDGELHVYTQPGYQPQWFGKATHYKKSFQYWFDGDSTQEGHYKMIPAQFYDGGHADIPGSIRVDLPLDIMSITYLHTKFGSQEAIEKQLIGQVLIKAVTMSCPLMTSRESYAEKKNSLIYYVEDQAMAGVYKTNQKEVKVVDQLTGQEKTAIALEILYDNKGLAMRQEKSMIQEANVSLNNLSFSKFQYDAIVQEQIATQQKSIMSVQTSIMNAKKAEQEAITVEQQGKANAATAKWEQEVIKAKRITEAESNKKVAELDVQTALLNKQKAILEGEGEATKKRLVMQANGALEQKLEVWLQAQRYWAEAFKGYQGNVSPQFMYGSGFGGGGGGNAATAFMEIMGAKAAKDLMLDLKNK